MNPGKYPIIQSNGQRIYKPSSSARIPPRGSEIFVGNLPRDLYEDELIPFFLQVGPIYQLRLMMDFSGETRGFCFVHYFTAEDANLAVKRFDKTIISSKTRHSYITVHISVDNCRLFVGNVPKNKCADNIKNDLMRIVDGIVKVIVYPERGDTEKNRGFAFVEFKSHATAAIARRKLMAGVVNLWNSHGNEVKLCVDWAEPEPVVDPMVLTEVKILYFKNIPIFWTPDHFKEFLTTMIRSVTVEKIYKRDHYAFVHFASREGAEFAFGVLEKMSGFLKYCGQGIEVEWARPCTFSKKYKSMQLPDNLCTSVPPKARKLVYESKKNIKKSIPMRFAFNDTTSDSSSNNSNTGEMPESLLWQYFNQLSLSHTI